MSHFFLRSKHYLLFIPLILPTLSSWILQGVYGQKIQEFTAEMEAGADFSFAGFDLADYNGYFYFFIGLSLLTLLTQIGWYRAVGQDLKRYLPDHVGLKDSTFKVTLAIQVIASFIMLGTFWYGWNWMGENIPNWIANDGVSPEEGEAMVLSGLKVVGLFFLVGIASFASQIYNCYFVGKTLKTIEEGRSVKGGELVGYVILSYLLMIGVWIMQPKINRLVETGSMSKGEEGDGVW